MTTEVAIRNDICCVLAADSAITINRLGETKVLNNGDKIFSLSAKYPVGVMFYNNVCICDCPVELIIKSYKERDGNKGKDKLVDYLNDFIGFIENSLELMPEDYRSQNLENLIYAHACAVMRDIKASKKQKEGDFSGKSGAIGEAYLLSEFINNESDRICKDGEYHVGFNDENRSEVYKYIEDRYEQILPEEMIKWVQNKDYLINYLSLIATKVTRTSSGYCGIVFSGYGEKEHFPSIITVKIYGFFKGKAIYSVDTGSSTSRERGGSVISFAEDEDITTYLNGVNNSVIKHIKKQITEEVCSLKASLECSLPSNYQAAIDKHIQHTKEKLNSSIDSYISGNRSEKILKVVSSLSKDEMAKMAEFLINLTVYRHKLSSSHETVSEPIDVAVISKHDGFVWVKRKYYFDREFNDEYKVRKGII